MTRAGRTTEISFPPVHGGSRWLHAPSAEPFADVGGHAGDASEDLISPSRHWSDDPRWMSCLVSAILHTIVLLVLALWTFTLSGESSASLQVKFAPASEPADAAIVQLEISKATTASVSVGPLEAQVPSIDLPIGELAAIRFGELHLDDELVEDPLATVSPELQALASSGATETASAGLRRLPSSSSLAGRSSSERQRIGKLHGATRDSEEAVEAALAWLANHQRGSGAWSFDLHANPCDGRCRDSKLKDDSTPTPSTAATGLALLAFLGAGYTHEEAKYAEVVQKGLYYLRGAGLETETGLDWQQGSMYGHGIALMAISEATAMTSKDGELDHELRQLAMQGTSFTCTAQHKNGSWGYVPGSPGDITLTGWQVLSLVAARRNQIGLPSLTMSRARRFVLSTSDENQYAFGYQGPPAKPTTTAIGLTLLLYLGESPGFTPFDGALTRMARRGPTLTNVYHDYYATLALHHAGHRDFDDYFALVRQHLIRTQARDGHEQGSWHFKDEWGDIGGRLYTTAMCAMILEVPYRYLPLYGPADDFPL